MNEAEDPSDSLSRRLVRELDSLPLRAPFPSQARYSLKAPQAVPLRRQGILLAAVAASLLAGFVGGFTISTRSADPAVWREQLVHTIQNIEAPLPQPVAPDTTPVPDSGPPGPAPSATGILQTPTPTPRPVVPVAAPTRHPEDTPEPSPSPRSSPRGKPTCGPEDSHHCAPPTSPTPQPSQSPDGD